jgi:hypothetical protein
VEKKTTERSASASNEETPTFHISLAEQTRALDGLKKKSAAGVDQILCELITIAYPAIKHRLLNILNAGLTNNWFPSGWKIARVCIIPKPGKKSYLSPEAYRPISILNTMGKIYERVIHTRLKKIAEEQNWFNNCQHGFREGRSTETAAHSLISHIEENFKQKKYTATTFLDIKSAFDYAWSPAILSAMINKGCPMYLVRTIKDFLRERRGKITIDGEDLEINIPTGCPQGSVLSDFLWITLMDAVFDIKFPFPTHLIAYADDLTVCCSDADPIRAALNVQTACNMIVKWLESIKLSINASKSTFVMFDWRKRQRIPFSTPIKITEVTVPPSKQATFLGLTLDPQLKWNIHIENKCNSALRTTHAIRQCLGLSWGLNRKRLKFLYSCVIEPMLTYCCSAWASAALMSSNRKKLRNIQRRIAILILRVFRTTPTDASLVLSGLTPADYKILEITTYKFLT